MKGLFVLILAFSSTNALASGGFSCIADDPTLTLEANGVTTHGMGSPVVQSESELTYKETDGVPPISTFNFNKSNVSQYWNYGDQFNLVLYVEGSKGADSFETTVVIQTKTKGDEETFTGTYDVSTFQSVKGASADHSASGSVTCTVE